MDDFDPRSPPPLLRAVTNKQINTQWHGNIKKKKRTKYYTSDGSWFPLDILSSLYIVFLTGRIGVGCVMFFCFLVMLCWTWRSKSVGTPGAKATGKKMRRSRKRLFVSFLSSRGGLRWGIGNPNKNEGMIFSSATQTELPIYFCFPFAFLPLLSFELFIK